MVGRHGAVGALRRFRHGMEHDRADPSPRTLASVGMGLRWALTIPRSIPLNPQFEIYWGLPLRHVPTPGGNLQDLGVHLQFAIAMF
jgi:hypothetical protein